MSALAYVAEFVVETHITKQVIRYRPIRGLENIQKGLFQIDINTTRPFFTRFNKPLNPSRGECFWFYEVQRVDIFFENGSKLRLLVICLILDIASQLIGACFCQVTAMCFDPTYRRLITATRLGLISIWNFNNGGCLHQFHTFDKR